MSLSDMIRVTITRVQVIAAMTTLRVGQCCEKGNETLIKIRHVSYKKSNNGGKYEISKTNSTILNKLRI